MSVSFFVYVDESGDEGFVFRPDHAGSSEWFVLSAVVVRLPDDPGLMDLVDQTRRELGRKPREPLHFRKLKHEHRLPYIRRISEAPIQLVSVLIHKPSIVEAERFSERSRLYFYASRFLLERVSWLCRDLAKRARIPSEAKVVFSNRSAMSYDELREYLEGLRRGAGGYDFQIDWDVVDPRRIEARAHDSLCGLQVADAVASSFFYGVNSSRHGFTEPRYATMLSKTVYRRGNKVLGYGLKFWPAGIVGSLDTPSGLEWLRGIM